MYNDFVDNTGRIAKTAAEVQAAVGDLLRQPGTSKAFADGMDTTKPGIDIMAEVSGGELQFMVRAVLKNTAERGMLSGRYMFEQMLTHFAAQNTVIDAIVSSWTYESNLNLFNCLSRVGLSQEQAAAGTITGQWAAAHGYTKTIDIVAESPGALAGVYKKVTVRFGK